MERSEKRLDVNRGWKAGLGWTGRFAFLGNRQGSGSGWGVVEL